MNEPNAIGNVLTIFNDAKGIYCCFCRQHYPEDLISMYSFNTRNTGSPEAHACITCAQNLVTCLQRALMQALLEAKP